MIAVVSSIVAASVVGSLHCTAMCSGLAAFGAAGTENRWAARASALGAYNVARGLGYVALGTVAGALGSTLDDAGLRIGLSRGAGVVASIVMIGWGIARLTGALDRARASGAAFVPVERLARRAASRPAVVRSAIIGGCTALLPCGFLHAFLVGAAGTGSAAEGALVMAAFWLGTLPSLVSLGLGVGALLGPLRKHASLVGALVLVFLGLSNLFDRWTPPWTHLGPPKAGIVTHAR
ncbi:MAG TPA: sulfite exporter TauE/SafE family protein [Polyangiaceae bacterium]|nr:sulfite exporter TauE/SafE family protein [Polyangiaceae bacterium]